MKKNLFRILLLLLVAILLAVFIPRVVNRVHLPELDNESALIEDADPETVAYEDSMALVQAVERREKSKVVIIGMDGSSWNILDPMIERGELPTFKNLLETGSYGDLQSTIFPVTPPAWTAMFAGSDVWKTGVYGFGKLDSVSREIVPTTSLDIQVPLLWDMVSKANLRVGVVNVPLTFPPKPVNGIMVTGMLTPEIVLVKKVTKINSGITEVDAAEIVPYGSASVSAPKRADIEVYGSDVTAYLIDTKEDQQPEFDSVLLVSSEITRSNSSSDSGDPSSLMIPQQIVTFPLGEFSPWIKIMIEEEGHSRIGWVRLGPELVGNTLLRFTCTPVYNTLARSDVPFCYPDTLKKDIAQRFERFIPFVSYVLPTIPDFADDAGEYLDFFYNYDEWDLFVFQYQVTDLIQHWDGVGEYTQQVYQKIDNHLKELIEHLPENTTLIIVSDHGLRGYKFLVNVNVWLDQMHLLAKDRKGNIDYKHSIAFHMYWGIFINKDELAKRASIIPGFDPPEDVSLYDAFIDFLIDEAQALNFPRSDKPMPIRLIRSPSDRLEPAPDLVVQAEYSNYIIHHEDLYHTGQDLITTPRQIGKKYNHRRNGLFIVAGPGIKKGYKSPKQEIFDITPTALYLLNLPVAQYFDGRIMDEIIEEAYLASHPQHTIHAYHVLQPELDHLDYKREALEEKLRAIGYIK